MKNIVFVLMIILSLCGCSQYSSNCNDLKSGTFKLFENEKHIGTIYRYNEYQVERYIGDKEYTVVKMEQQNCLFYFRAYKIKTELDTLTWSTHYKIISKGKYSFESKPTFLKTVDYSYKGTIEKTSEKIDEKIINYFNTLNDSNGNVSN